jgi:hypothetical protein
MWCARVRTRWCHVEAAIALPSLASVMRDGVTRRIGLILGKGPVFVYPLSRIPTVSEEGVIDKFLPFGDRFRSFRMYYAVHHLF